jgi:hypothetical protein
MKRSLNLLAILGWTLLAGSSASGFSLLGPYAPWMTLELNYRMRDDIGGPVDLHEEYRWNLPVLTYGFDRSFLDYFGPQGVAAVEEAIQVLNDLPPASNLVLTNYSPNVQRTHYPAQSDALVDLKSDTLFLLLRQMGLAPAIRNYCTLRQWPDDPFGLFGWNLSEAGLPDWFYGEYGLRRNFDPVALDASHWVNDWFLSFRIMFYYQPRWADAIETIPDPFPPPSWPVSGGLAGDAWGYGDPRGLYFLGLSRDDAGGLKYLLNRTNINVEDLAGEVTSSIGNPGDLVRLAPRPGIDNVQFVRHTTLATGGFARVTNAFADVFLSNGIATTQAVQRVISEPDTLFSARDFGPKLVCSGSNYVLDASERWRCSDTAGWRDYSAENGRAGALGPGVIAPPVRITFNTLGRYVAAVGGVANQNDVGLWSWARFDATTNAPIIFDGGYPLGVPCTLSTSLVITNGVPMVEWFWLSQAGAPYQIETSTNLPNWSVLQIGTNLSGVVRTLLPATQAHQFFRAVTAQTP